MWSSMRVALLSKNHAKMLWASLGTDREEINVSRSEGEGPYSEGARVPMERGVQ